jgi:hypothetical protein
MQLFDTGVEKLNITMFRFGESLPGHYEDQPRGHYEDHLYEDQQQAPTVQGGSGGGGDWEPRRYASSYDDYTNYYNSNYENTNPYNSRPQGRSSPVVKTV